MRNRIAAFLTFIFLWYLIVIAGVMVPYPHSVLKKFIFLLIYPEPVLGKNLIEHSAFSLMRVIAGSSIAFMIAIPLGIVMGWNRGIDEFLSTFTEIFRPIPPLAWIPLSYILFASFSNPVQTAQIFIVFVGAFFPCLLSVREFARSTDRNLIEMAKAFNASDSEILKKIVIPSSIPGMLSGIRIGLGVGWMTIVAAEMLATSGSGLGYFIMVMYEVGGRTEEILSGMLAIGIIGYLMSTLVVRVESKLLRWR
ncbi:ABC-type nitrate/sulfonate/bicarbonate transport system, permease component [Archaeoglobus sulfaticallidus PM70-1]|uniref:ABC-type nitrate/sulfonate/bicarbonate transport system, permease component n=1 Tax=Archaeoglobus sulfaticallidus PM70-1 TaxID=387631 RepID=N0BDS7_9EURY|nr:ABC transporter permease [Archaeoglobus sulfaticallidus]AGK60387.1 ABC-type nitrate/sulfonate/bicarbonate transport system, permease component [Archaeoglobus sulfaticallidus PM70-1]